MLLPLASFEGPYVCVEFLGKNLLSLKETVESKVSVEFGVTYYGNYGSKINIKFGGKRYYP
jgi:hypothetical protein